MESRRLYKWVIKMLKTIVLICLLGFILLLPLSYSIPVTSQQSSPIGTLTMTKILTNVTAISTCLVNVSNPSGVITQTSGTLYGNIRIIINVTLTNSNSTYGIQLSSFFLIVTQNNMVVSNTTNINQNQNPTNIIKNVLLFPNIPVILILSFRPTCVTSSNIAKLLYLDGIFNFQYTLP